MSYANTSLAPKRNKARRALIVVLVLIAIVVGSRFLETGSVHVLPSPQVTVTSGTGTLYGSAAADPVSLATGASLALHESDEVVCGPLCTATITLGDSRTLELAENTRVTLLNTEWNLSERSNPAWVALHQGQVAVRVSASTLASAPLKLDTDTITLETDEATFSCRTPDRDHAYVAVFAGQVMVSMGREQLLVAGGQSLQATLGHPLEARMMTDAELAAQPQSTPAPEATALPGIATTPTAKAIGVSSTNQNSTGLTYTVQSGDTLFSIARRYHLGWETLWEANKAIVPSPEQLKAGQVLVIPSGD